MAGAKCAVVRVKKVASSYGAGIVGCKAVAKKPPKRQRPTTAAAVVDEGTPRKVTFRQPIAWFIDQQPQQQVGSSLPNARPQKRAKVSAEAEGFSRADWMFDPAECIRLQQLTQPITVDACADDAGLSKQHPRFCSPSNNFLDFDCSGEHVWMNAPFDQLCTFISHYKQCKDKAPGSTSALIVVPVLGRHPVNQLVRGMQKLVDYPVGTQLFTGVNSNGSLLQCRKGIPWRVAVYYDPPRSMKPAYVHRPGRQQPQPEHYEASGVVIDCRLSGVDATATLDSGASHCAINSTWVEQHQVHTTPCSDVIALADGSSIRAKGRCRVRLQSGALNTTVDCYVVDLAPQYQCLVGMDFLKSHGIQITFSGENVTVTARKGQQRVTLPMAKPNLPEAPKTLAQITLSALQAKRAIRKGAHFFLVQVERVGDQQSKVAVLDKHGLIPDHDLQQLLAHYKDSVFVDGLPPAIDAPGKRIDFEVIPTVPGAAPTHRKMYRLTPEERKELQNRIKEMLEKGMIEPSTSPYSASILFVKKKHGGLRMVQDLRLLNSITVRSRAPIPRIDELLDSLSGKKIFSLLDLSGGYHQLILPESDKPKTAFATPYGHYQWRVLPQGLCNAPSAFQATMNKLFKHMLGRSVFIYLDDILVASESPEEHKQHLQEVLQILKDNHLYAAIQKCHFNKPEVNYLGHVVGRDGLRPDPQKVQVVRDWPKPSSVHEVRSFLGLTNYFRRFIKDYASKAAPLNRLLQKDGSQECRWNPACDKSFESLKHALVNAPVLAIPDLEKPYELEVWTDASDTAVGAVLMQNGHPIAYESRKFSSAERNYHTTDRELVAIIHALRVWRCFLEGAEFKVKCDHQALSSLMTKSQITPRQARWLEFLERFDLQIDHVPGKANPVADALSRATHGPEGPVLAVMGRKKPRDKRILTPPAAEWWTEIREASKVDPWFSTAANTKGLTCTDGIWYKGHLVVLPEAVRQKCIAECHDSPYSGHKGIAKTMDLLRRDYWWPCMKKDVTQFVTTCAACQRNKARNQKPGGLLQPLPIPQERWHSVSMDFITGLPVTAKGYDSIYVVLDRLTKMAHFIPCTKDISALETAQLYVDHVYKLHGAPLEIISDRDTKFQSAFWQGLVALLGTKHKMSSAFHPQTDGGTERLNRVLEEYLRAFVGPDQSDWDKWLGLAEFAYNNSKQASTGYTPFYLNYGYHPRTPSTPKPSPSERNPTAVEIAQTIDQAVKQAKQLLHAAQQAQQTQANRSRRDLSFQVGQQVLLSTKNIKLKTPGTQKLLPKYVGPFKVLAKAGPVAYKLHLPDCMQMHPVFHVSLLTEYKEGGRYQPPPPEIVFDDSIWFPIDKILDERRVGRAKKKQYLCKFTGYGSEWNQWCDEKDVTEVAIRDWRRSRASVN